MFHGSLFRSSMGRFFSSTDAEGSDISRICHRFCMKDLGDPSQCFFGNPIPVIVAYYWSMISDHYFILFPCNSHSHRRRKAIADWHFEMPEFVPSKSPAHSQFRSKAGLSGPKTSMSGCIKHERYSDDHLFVITGYNCDYTFYKWGDFLVVITGIFGHNWFVGIKQAWSNASPRFWKSTPKSISSSS